jgi:hypothetical protein
LKTTELDRATVEQWATEFLTHAREHLHHSEEISLARVEQVRQS